MATDPAGTAVRGADFRDTANSAGNRDKYGNPGVNPTNATR